MPAVAQANFLAGLHYHDWRTESSSSRAAHRRIHDAANRAVDDALTAVADRPEVLALADRADGTEDHGVGRCSRDTERQQGHHAAGNGDIVA